MIHRNLLSHPILTPCFRFLSSHYHSSFMFYCYIILWSMVIVSSNSVCLEDDIAAIKNDSRNNCNNRQTNLNNRIGHKQHNDNQSYRNRDPSFFDSNYIANVNLTMEVMNKYYDSNIGVKPNSITASEIDDCHMYHYSKDDDLNYNGNIRIVDVTSKRNMTTIITLKTSSKIAKTAATARDISVSHRRHHRSLQKCVYDEFNLRQAIRNATNDTLSVTYIDICVKYMKINASHDFNAGEEYLHGIPIRNQRLEFHCRLGNSNASGSTEKCTFDAQQLSRHFHISNANVTFYGIDFVNGSTLNTIYDSKNDPYLYNVSGGSLYVNASTISTVNCSFNNNFGGVGGAIYLSYSDLYMTRCHMRLNYASSIRYDGYYYEYSGYGGAISLVYSKLSLVGGNNPSAPTIMEENKADKSGGVIMSSHSNITTIDGYFEFQNNGAGFVRYKICLLLLQLLLLLLLLLVDCSTPSPLINIHAYSFTRINCFVH
jgi:hypothetical protein